VIAVDASAVLAILLDESDAQRFKLCLARAGESVISAVNYWEALAKAQAIHGAAGPQLVDELLAEFRVAVVAADRAAAGAAAVAFARFGRRTPAGLNLGDCFAYALAQREGDGLLFKGSDFPKTDIKSALA
jgi:ribonuclease VapC